MNELFDDVSRKEHCYQTDRFFNFIKQGTERFDVYDALAHEFGHEIQYLNVGTQVWSKLTYNDKENFAIEKSNLIRKYFEKSIQKLLK